MIRTPRTHQPPLPKSWNVKPAAHATRDRLEEESIKRIRLENVEYEWTLAPVRSFARTLRVYTAEFTGLGLVCGRMAVVWSARLAASSLVNIVLLPPPYAVGCSCLPWRRDLSAPGQQPTAGATRSSPTMPAHDSLTSSKMIMTHSGT